MIILPVKSRLGDVDSGQPETSSITLDKKKDRRFSALSLATFSLDSILSSNRIIITENMAGPAENTFQKYLKFQAEHSV